MKKFLASALALALSLSLCVSLLPGAAAEDKAGGGFTDVPAGSWFAEGVALCAEKGIMVGTGEGRFSPDAILTEAECLTLALRLYDLQRGGSGGFLPAPEEAGHMTLTLHDGTVFEGYSAGSSPFWTWSWTNGNWGVCVKPPGETPEEQEAWGNAHEGSAVFTVEGTAYPGTVDCWFPTGGWAIMFQPDSEENGEEGILRGAVNSGIPAPGAWWRDAVYTAHQWGLADPTATPGIDGLVSPWLGESRSARREEFAKALFDAAGELKQLYTVDWLPDLERSEQSESIFKLYEAGILSGVDDVGTFSPFGELTRAEAAVMVARVLAPSLRLKEPPRTVDAYEQAVLRLRSGDGYCNERSFDAPTATVFLFDGGILRGPGNLVLIGKARGAKGEGTVVTLPRPPYMGYGTDPVPPDTAVLSDDGKTFTYTYTFPEAHIENGLPVRPAGTYTYTVDMTTGEVAEDAPVLPQTGYDRAVAELRGSYGYIQETEDTREFDQCTVFIYDANSIMYTHRGAMRAIFKPGSALGDGTVIDLPYVSTTAIRIPADRYGGVDWDLETPNFTWSYFFDVPAYDYSGKEAVAVAPGLTTFTLDLESGKISRRFEPVSYENAREHVLRERAIEGGQLIRDRYHNGTYESPICSVIRVYGRVGGTGEDEGNPFDGMEDHAYYLVYKSGSSFPEGTTKRLTLPSTEILFSPTYGYYPTTRIPLEESLFADGSSFTYVYRFAWPLSYTDGHGQEVTLHDAGTYTYTVDLATGETTVKHEPLQTDYAVEKELDNDLANVRLVYTQPHGVKDYQLLVTDKATGLLYHAVLPTTQVIPLPGGSIYTPTTIAPNTILLDDETGWVDYIYRFETPLVENGTRYHEAGICSYVLNTGSSGSFNYGFSRSEMTYGEMLQERLSRAREVDLQVENSQCTFLLTTCSGSRGSVYSNLSLIFKPGSALGEGIVMSYPSIRHGDVTYVPQVTVDEETMTLSYSYYFDQPLTSQYDSGSGPESWVDYAAGTYAYTVDLTTGEVTDTFIPKE